jgi:hypothetical protein
MATFTFRIEQSDRDPTERTRALSDEAEAFAYAKQLLKDWPEYRVIDVAQDGALINRLRPQAP